ncbi:hydroxyacid oxidase 1, partial [Ixodes scapularis]
VANLEGVGGGLDPSSGSGLAAYGEKLFDPSLTWNDIKWLRSITNLKVIAKGVLTAEDARNAVNSGVSGILVSNHGARQLDGVTSTIEALPEIIRAVRGRVEVYLDGGIRHGTDAIKALALGAKAVFVGRPALWGLAYNGEDGVTQMLEILRKELDLGMALIGQVREYAGTPVYRKQGPKWCVASPGGPRRVQTYPGLGSTTRTPFSLDTESPRTARRG